MYQERELYSVEETAREMYRMAHAWKEDMGKYATLSLPEVFNLLKNIPYRRDPPTTEVLQRPFYTLSRSGYGGDCDDKAIASGAWAALLGHPFRFIASSKMPNKALHHVFTEIMINGEWVIFDPTYSYNQLGRPIGVFTKRVVLQP